MPPRPHARTFRSVIGTLVALHFALAQAGMAQGATHQATLHAAPSAVLAGTAAWPCHSLAGRGPHTVLTLAGAAALGVSHAPCCATSGCHCAGACDLGTVASAALIDIAGCTGASPFTTRAALPPQMARELRPPIAD